MVSTITGPAGPGEHDELRALCNHAAVRGEEAGVLGGGHRLRRRLRGRRHAAAAARVPRDGAAPLRPGAQPADAERVGVRGGVPAALLRRRRGAAAGRLPAPVRAVEPRRRRVAPLSSPAGSPPRTVAGGPGSFSSGCCPRCHGRAR